MAQLMMHAEVLKRFYKLPTKVQKKVPELIEKFQNNPWDATIGLHSLKESMLDSKVRGADLPDGYRAIVIAPEQGDTFLLVHIDSHDRAYAWAKNKRFEVHSSTGAFQIFDVQETTQALQDANSVITKVPDYPLSSLTDDDLFHAGVPKPLIPAVRQINSDHELEVLSEYLPSECFEVLLGITAGLSLDAALAQALGTDTDSNQPVTIAGPGDFSQLTQRPNRDLVVVEGEETLKTMLEGGSLEEWRIFLHPKQKKIVEWRTNGPMSITGAAGTGKTVALMHRAVYLAKHLHNPKERILLTTFTTNLSVTIKSYLRRLDPIAAEHIEVTNLNQLARTICARSGWKGRIASPEELNDLWEEVWEDPTIVNLPMSKAELQKEFDFVVDPNGVDSEEAYLTTLRTGRPRMGRKERREAWKIFQAFRRLLLKRNLLTFEGAIHQARFAVEQGNFPPFRHVLADEVQDFSLEALKLIAALSQVNKGLTDPLCVAGDGHQRIYRGKVPLSLAGIYVTGRSRQLKVNYRTSEQIRLFAQSILEGIAVDDLDDGQTTIVGDRSVFKGPQPEIVQCTDEKEETKRIVNWVKQLIKEDGFAAYEICITPYKGAVRTALEAEGILTYELKPREEDPGSEEPGVRFGTMKRIKGLEFRAIAMGCTIESDAMNNLATAELLERCERYVAATRARERLLVCVSLKY
ncbi:MAG: UvrD-helicase domain-containing protein [Scytonema sp. PMC 1069.18]|nr:UvrD-helicase domain-containing protein [Scytonema sp. PMC 1069.18]MEC4883575.1 UvrD-helicase domain-containing protein [Scytonema sp. PMC 1070.18]